MPGTRIDALADNGRTYSVKSTNNSTAKHPFSLSLPSGMGYRLVMITHEGTADEVITPIGFKDAQGNELYGKNIVKPTHLVCFSLILC